MKETHLSFMSSFNFLRVNSGVPLISVVIPSARNVAIIVCPPSVWDLLDISSTHHFREGLVVVVVYVGVCSDGCCEVAFITP